MVKTIWPLLGKIIIHEGHEGNEAKTFKSFMPFMVNKKYEIQRGKAHIVTR
jgi:hypothetical protein